MNARSYWNDYVSRHGGPSQVARALDIPYQTIRSVCTGHRGIGKSLAERMASADASLDPQILVWVRANDDIAPVAFAPAPKRKRTA